MLTKQSMISRDAARQKLNRIDRYCSLWNPIDQASTLSSTQEPQPIPGTASAKRRAQIDGRNI
jgi:hypothetical protein